MGCVRIGDIDVNEAVDDEGSGCVVLPKRSLVPALSSYHE